MNLTSIVIWDLMNDWYINKKDKKNELKKKEIVVI